MAWQQSDLDRLDAAMSSGVKKVTFADGRSREFQDLGEMTKLRTLMKAELAEASSQVAPRRTVVARFGRRR